MVAEIGRFYVIIVLCDNSPCGGGTVRSREHWRILKYEILQTPESLKSEEDEYSSE